MSARRHAAAYLAAVLALGLAGCGSSDEGGEDSATSTSEASDAADSSPSSSAAPCAEDAKCYDFAGPGSGWPEADEAGYYAKQDDYLDGTYRMTSREAGTWNAPAPVKVTDLANDYSVTIEADAVMGQGFPASAAWGASCWTGAENGLGLTGFGVYVQPKTVTVGVWGGADGEFKPLKSRDVSSVLKPAEKNRLVLSCEQDTSSGSVEAAVGVELNGKRVVSVAYGKGVQNVSWEVADGVGLLVAGKGGDVFFDDVVITGKCDSDFC